MYKDNVGSVGKALDSLAFLQLEFSADERYLACNFAGQIWLWRLIDGQLLQTFSGVLTSDSFAFAPDSVVVCGGEYVQMWNISTKRTLWTINVSPRTHLAISPCGRYLATGGDDKTVHLWHVSNGRPIRTFEGHTGSILKLSFSPCGRYLASTSANEVRLWLVER